VDVEGFEASIVPSWVPWLEALRPTVFLSMHRFIRYGTVTTAAVHIYIYNVPHISVVYTDKSSLPPFSFPYILREFSDDELNGIVAFLNMFPYVAASIGTLYSTQYHIAIDTVIASYTYAHM
jgi:hypothetical protein